MNALSFSRAWRVITISLMVGFTYLSSPIAYAQNIPTEDLIKQITGKKAAGTTTTGVDESRLRDAADDTIEEKVTAGRLENAPTLKEFSPIELEYQNRSGQDILRADLIEAVQKARMAYAEGKSSGNEDDIRLMEQELLQHFGHELFVGGKSVSGAYLGRIQDSYVLGIGDELAITMVGNNASSTVTKVDREGKIIVEGLKPLSVAGRTFADVRDDLSNQVKASMVGTELYLSMGGLRRVTVQVLGQVRQPGNIVVDSSSDLLAVLTKSGGITKMGSLRNVKIITGDKTRIVDLYRVLMGGDVDLTISNGARIVVPMIGRTVAIEGKVRRPAIYEMVGDESFYLGDLITLGGGTLRNGGNLIRRSYITSEGREKLASLSDVKSNLENNDLISVYYDSWKPELGVRAVGHVRSTQSFILKDKPTVSTLLKKGELLLENVYPYFATLRRKDPTFGKYNYLALNLAPIIAGVEDVDLAEGDELIVFSEADIKFLSSNKFRMALTGDDIEITGNGIETMGGDIEADTCIAFAPIIQAKATEKYNWLKTILSNEGTIDDGCPIIFEENELLFPFVIEHAISLQGALRSPGLFPILSGVALNDLVFYAGGLTRHVDLSHVDGAILNEGDLLSLDRRVYDFTSTNMNSVELVAGSRFTFYSSDTDLEIGSVTLQGAVKRPGIYPIMSGDLLSEVIERAGGLKENAYPYGSIFTRMSVREQQRVNMRRAVSNIRDALAYAALKNENTEISPELVNMLLAGTDDIDIIGRMVVETDPDVLEARSELNILVEPGDILFVPRRPSYILIAGDVLNAGALHFDPDKTVEDYIDQAGGFQVTADDDRIYVVYPNGVAEPVSRSFWSKANITLTPGTTIVIPKNLSPIDGLRMVGEVTNILGQLAVTVASLAVISSY